MTIRKCKPSDRDPNRPASEQVWCLYSKDEGKLLGRHPTKESAEKQERAIQISKARAKGHKIPKKSAAAWVRVAAGDTDVSVAFFSAVTGVAKKMGFGVKKYQHGNVYNVQLTIPEEKRALYGMGEDDTVNMDCFERPDGVGLRVHTNNGEARILVDITPDNFKVRRKEDASIGLVKLTEIVSRIMSGTIPGAQQKAAALRMASVSLTALMHTATPVWNSIRIQNVAEDILNSGKTLMHRIKYSRETGDDGSWLLDVSLREIQQLKRTLELAERGIQKAQQG